MKKIFSLLVTLLTLIWIIYILIKIIHPTYINRKMTFLVKEQWIDLVKLYNTMVSYKYIEIIRSIIHNNTADFFLKNEIKKFKETYPFIIWWESYFSYLKQKAYTWIKLEDIYKLQDKILSKYKIKKKENWILFYTDTKYTPYILNKDKNTYCFTMDDLDLYVKNKIAWQDILNNLSSLIIYNKTLWKYLKKVDICITYNNNRSFSLYWKDILPEHTFLNF